MLVLEFVFLCCCFIVYADNNDDDDDDIDDDDVCWYLCTSLCLMRYELPKTYHVYRVFIDKSIDLLKTVSMSHYVP